MGAPFSLDHAACGHTAENRSVVQIVAGVADCCRSMHCMGVSLWKNPTGTLCGCSLPAMDQGEHQDLDAVVVTGFAGQDDVGELVGADVVQRPVCTLVAFEPPARAQ